MHKDINFFISLTPPPFHPLPFSFLLSFCRSLAPGWPETHRTYHNTENDLEILISCLYLPHAVL